MGDLRANRRDFSKIAVATAGGLAAASVADHAKGATSNEIQFYESLIGSEFCVVDAEGIEHRLTLREVANHHSERDRDRPTTLSRHQGFSLLFDASAKKFDYSTMCRVRHAALGEVDLLFAAVDVESDLEVAFN